MNETTKPEICPKCGGEVWGLEYPWGHPNRYDGVSEWMCEKTAPFSSEPKCTFRIGRWCGKPLAKDECEPRYCLSEAHPKNT